MRNPEYNISIFGYAIEGAVGRYSFTKISIPVNSERFKESLGDALRLARPLRTAQVIIVETNRGQKFESSRLAFAEGKMF